MLDGPGWTRQLKGKLAVEAVLLRHDAVLVGKRMMVRHTATGQASRPVSGSGQVDGTADLDRGRVFLGHL